MIRCGLVFVIVVIVIADTSLNGNLSGEIWDAGRRYLFTYMTDRGCVSLIAVGSMRVHEGCMGDDFVYADQYCSCSIRIAKGSISGSLRMLSVRSWLLCRLFYRILSWCVVTISKGLPLFFNILFSVLIFGACVVECTVFVIAVCTFFDSAFAFPRVVVSCAVCTLGFLCAHLRLVSESLTVEALFYLELRAVFVGLIAPGSDFNST